MTPTPQPTVDCSVYNKATSAYCTAFEFKETANDQMLAIVPVAIIAFFSIVFVLFSIRWLRNIINM